MLAVMTVVALVVYDRLGLVVLRSARRNSDQCRAGAFVLAGAVPSSPEPCGRHSFNTRVVPDRPVDPKTRKDHHGMTTTGSTTRVARKPTATLAAAAVAAATLVLALGSASPAEAAFPGVNGKIAYASQDAVSSNIWVMNPDGSGRTYLAASLAPERDPAFSPDGSKIVYTRGGNSQTDIWVMNADGTGQTNLTPGLLGYEGGAAWSPDGTKIAFSSQRGGDYNNYDICVMNADGTGQTQLTYCPAFDGGPTWSPDGNARATAEQRPRGTLRA